MIMKKIILLSLFLVSIIYSYAQGWEEVGTGANALKANNAITALCYDKGNGTLYAGGQFTDSLSKLSGHRYLAKWNGVSWEQMGVGDNALKATSNTMAICVDAAHNVYTVGKINAAGKYCVMKWDGIAWSELGTGAASLNANSLVESLCADAIGNIYAAGRFTNAAGKQYVAKWNGTSWSEIGTGLNALDADDEIKAIVCDQLGNLYAGGSFRKNGYIYVAKWDGITWSRIGSGSNPLNIVSGGVAINTLYADNTGNIYAGGVFSNVAGYQYVTKWDGTTWTELGTGENALKPISHIDAITGDKWGNIYADGPISTSGKFYVAKWDGISWQEVGSGSEALNPNSEIWSLCTDTSGGLYAAGGFTDRLVSDSGYKYVAKYNITNSIIETGKSTNLAIWPNPANNYLNVNCSVVGSYRYAIYDIYGIVLADGETNQVQNIIDISGLPFGVYFFVVEKLQTKLKFIKN